MENVDPVVTTLQAVETLQHEVRSLKEAFQAELARAHSTSGMHDNGYGS